MLLWLWFHISTYIYFFLISWLLYFIAVLSQIAWQLTPPTGTLTSILLLSCLVLCLCVHFAHLAPAICKQPKYPSNCQLKAKSLPTGGRSGFMLAVCSIPSEGTTRKLGGANSTWTHVMGQQQGKQGVAAAPEPAPPPVLEAGVIKAAPVSRIKGLKPRQPSKESGAWSPALAGGVALGAGPPSGTMLGMFNELSNGKHRVLNLVSLFLYFLRVRCVILKPV